MGNVVGGRVWMNSTTYLVMNVTLTQLMSFSPSTFARIRPPLVAVSVSIKVMVTDSDILASTFGMADRRTLKKSQSAPALDLWESQVHSYAQSKGVAFHSSLQFLPQILLLT